MIRRVREGPIDGRHVRDPAPRVREDESLEEPGVLGGEVLSYSPAHRDVEYVRGAGFLRQHRRVPLGHVLDTDPLSRRRGRLTT